MLPWCSGCSYRPTVLHPLTTTVIVGLILLLVPCVPGSAKAASPSADNLQITGDFRFRVEEDWDSQSAAGSERDDRLRARVRTRLALVFTPSGTYQLGVRLRSGADGSQQSPHVTVIDANDNDTGPANFNLDKWYLKLSHRRLSGWVGRNSFPFWKQNELFWDDDATPAGLSAKALTEIGESGALSLNTAYLSLPAGMLAFSGNLAGVQAVYSHSGETTDLTLAGGFYLIEANRDDSDAATLLSGNGLRDYRIWSGSAQFKVVAAERPLVLGADYMHNAESYSSTDPDPVTAANHDETNGFVLSLKYGGLKEKGQWLAAYHFARIEALAVNASYAQDDWVRWGSPTQTRSSNLQGHEFRFAYAFSGVVNLVTRLYLVEAITTDEDGNRLRMDLNFSFK